MAFSGLTSYGTETTHLLHQTIGRNEVLYLLLAVQTGAELSGVSMSEMSNTSWQWSIFYL